MAVREDFQPSGSSQERLAILTLLVAITSMTHMVSFQWWTDLLTGRVLCATTVLIFLFPRSVAAFALFLVTSLYHWSTLLPLVPNHVFFELIVHMTLLAAMVISLLDRRSGQSAKESDEDCLAQGIFRLVRPLMIAELVLLYLFTVVHKLNEDFFNPAVSCAVSMHHEVAELFPGLPEGPWTWWPTIIGTIVIELAIPLLFISRRTRSIGVMIGLGFHLFLALHPHGGIYSFTGLLFTLYFVFLSDESALWLITMAGRLSLTIRVALKFFTLAGFFTAIYLQVVTMRESHSFDDLNSIGFTFWLPIALGIAVAYTLSIFIGKRMSKSGVGSVGAVPVFNRTPGSLLLWLFPLLVFLNGCSPYLGLKTTTAFAMFSNLRTEGGRGNHFFIGDIAIFDYQDDLVEVLESNDSQFWELASSGDLIPWFEFRRMASRSPLPNARITIRRGGEIVRLSRQGVSPVSQEAFEPHAWWLAKFLHFRSISPFEQPMKCCW